MKNILQSLNDDLDSEKITLHDAAVALHKAGFINFIDEEDTRKLLNSQASFDSKIK